MRAMRREQPVRGGWLRWARRDPITGLVAFPDFHRRFPRVLAHSAAAGERILLAVGDVDHLKAYVEGRNSTDPTLFGHLAGNAVMTTLGRTARDWLADERPRRAVLATFGGDEIIVAAVTPTADAGRAALARLRDALATALPCTVSFAYAIDTYARPLDDARQQYTARLVSIDRALFAGKHQRNGARGGFLLDADGRASPRARRVTARLVRRGDVTFLRLPGDGRDGLVRGHSCCVRAAGHDFTTVAIDAGGDVLLRSDQLLDGAAATDDIPIELEPTAVRGPLRAPEELLAALTQHGLALDGLTEGEKRQFGSFIREARNGTVRRKRIASVIAALQARRDA